jgi:hypothetical protein
MWCRRMPRCCLPSRRPAAVVSATTPLTVLGGGQGGTCVHGCVGGRGGGGRSHAARHVRRHSADSLHGRPAVELARGPPRLRGALCQCVNGRAPLLLEPPPPTSAATAAAAGVCAARMRGDPSGAASATAATAATAEAVHPTGPAWSAAPRTAAAGWRDHPAPAPPPPPPPPPPPVWRRCVNPPPSVTAMDPIVELLRRDARGTLCAAVSTRTT